LRCFTTII